MPYTAKKQTTIKVDLQTENHGPEHAEIERNIAKLLKQPVSDALGDIPTAADVKAVKITVVSEDN